MLAVVTLVLAGGVRAADPPKAASPQKKHKWLKQLEGEWVTESEMLMVPGQPPVKCKGTEVVRSLGGFWTVGEIKSDFMGTPVTGIMTLGYDRSRKSTSAAGCARSTATSGSTRGRSMPPARC
jgi:hypothetical protein